MKKILNDKLIFVFFILLCIFSSQLLAQNDSVQIDLILNAKKVRSQICFPEIDYKTMKSLIVVSSDTTRFILSISKEFSDSTALPGIKFGSLLVKFLVLRNTKRSYQIKMPVKIIRNCTILIFEFEGCSYYFKRDNDKSSLFEIFEIKSTFEKEKYGCCDRKFREKDFKN